MQVEIEQKGEDLHLHIPKDVKEIRVIRHREDRKLLVISEMGFAKRTLIDEYRVIARGKKGIPTFNVKNKTGPVAGALLVNDDQDVMVVTEKGQMIRIAASSVSVTGRKAQGARLIKLDDEDRVIGIVAVPKGEEL